MATDTPLKPEKSLDNLVPKPIEGLVEGVPATEEPKQTVEKEPVPVSPESKPLDGLTPKADGVSSVEVGVVSEELKEERKVPVAESSLIDLKIIKGILGEEEALKQVYTALKPEQKMGFTAQGEEVALKIQQLLMAKYVDPGKIRKLIYGWLSAICDQLYAEQVALLKANSFLNLLKSKEEK